MNTPPILPLTPSLPPPPKSEEDLLKWTRHFTLSLARMYRTIALRLDKMTLEGVLADRPDADGSRRYYWATDTDQQFYDEAGTWVEVGGGGGGAPTDAAYIVQTADGDLSAEQALDALSDGLLKHASGVVAMAIAGTDYPTVGAVASNTSHAASEGLDHAAVRRNADVLNGHIVETISITAPESGGTVYATLEAQGGGDLTLMWSDGPATLDCTPAKTVALTAGSDTSPTRNYVYVLKSSGALTASTSGWPGTEYAPIADIIVQTAASVATKEVMKNHAWPDHISGTDDVGHLAHINGWIRGKDATWVSGVAPDLTITVGPGSDTVIFTCTAGRVRQLHEHTFPAFPGTPDIYVHNDFIAAFKILTDLNQLDAYSDGSAIGNGDYFSVVLKGVVSEAEGECKLLLGLPSGGYNLESQAIQDVDGTSDYTIPADYKGCGFLVVRYIMRFRSLDSGTFTKIAEEDLRGLDPQTAAGGSAVHTSSFADNMFEIYSNLDPTAKLVIDAALVAAATTHTITMPNASVNLGAIATNSAHVIGDGSGHADVATNTTHLTAQDVHMARTRLLFRFTVTKPLDLDEAATLPLYKNRSGNDMVITAIYSSSDTNNTVFTLKETDGEDYGTLATVRAVTISTAGTNHYYNNATGLSITVEDGNDIVLDNDAADDPAYIACDVYGHWV